MLLARSVAVMLLAITLVPSASAAQSCRESPGFRGLDFWLGDWDVFVEGQQVGTNRIESILSGCAILEHWVDGRGNEGKSLFYYQPVSETWKQVWVTERATMPGGLKEKTLVERFPDGGVRFQGRIDLKDGGSYLDRTTLTPADDGTVRQVIERSDDGGASWQVGFDAIYRRQTGSD